MSANFTPAGRFFSRSFGRLSFSVCSLARVIAIIGGENAGLPIHSGIVPSLLPAFSAPTDVNSLPSLATSSGVPLANDGGARAASRSATASSLFFMAFLSSECVRDGRRDVVAVGERVVAPAEVLIDERAGPVLAVLEHERRHEPAVALDVVLH